MKVATLQDLAIEGLRDIYDAEDQIMKAIPKMIENTTSTDLADLLEQHLKETEAQLERLDDIFDELGVQGESKTSSAMKAIIAEGEKMVESIDNADLADAAIIFAAQHVEHYEIATYGSAIEYAKLLKQDNIVKLLKENLAEEEAADKKLSKLAETYINKEALEATA